MKKMILYLMMGFTFITTHVFAASSFQATGAENNPCPMPIIEHVSIIQYEGYCKAHIQLSNQYPHSDYFRLTASKSGKSLHSTFQGDNFLITNLQPNTEYSIKMLDECGAEVEVGMIDTKISDDPMVTVSVKMYDALMDYLKQTDPQPLGRVLAELKTVSNYEKIAFIQQFFMKGEAYKTDNGDIVPEIPRGGGGEPTDCFCNSIRTSQLAFPSVMNFTTGTVGEYTNPGNNVPQSLGGKKNTSTWFFQNNKGAAKYHSLYTEGYNAEKGLDLENNFSYDNGTITSYQQSWIRVAFICMNGDELPAECACEKNIDFWYRYDTRVETFAKVLDGNGFSTNSVSQAEDMAMVSFYEEFNPGNLEVLGMALARASSKCARTTNPAFWTTTAQLGGNITTIALSIVAASQSGGSLPQAVLTQLSTQLQNYYNSVATWINTPYYNPGECDNGDTKNGSVQGSVAKKLKPNTPMVLAINSFDKQLAGGRRAWQSYAKVNSDFHIASLIHHDANETTPIHCCTPKVASWIVGSIDGPRTTDMLKLEVAEKFDGHVPLPPSNMGNGYTVPKEYGFLSQLSNNSLCNKVGVNARIGGKANIVLRELSEKEQQNLKAIYIWDITGRLLAQSNKEDMLPGLSMAQFVNDHLINATPGVYVVYLDVEGAPVTEKVVIH